MSTFLEEQIAKCQAKQKYATEIDARASGKERAKFEKNPLFVYLCPYCSSWHLTKRARYSEYWNVNAEHISLDNYVDILGDPLFWARLQDMPFNEAEEHLKRKIAYVKEMRSFTDPREQHDYFPNRLNNLQKRMEMELHFITQKDNKRGWKTAVVELFGEEAWWKIIERIRMYERGGE